MGMTGHETNNGDKKMNAAQQNLIRDTKVILADLETIGTPAAAAAARDLILRTTAMLADLGPVMIGDLAEALGG